VGYAGGTTDNPTYSTIGDHSETVQIEYDPEQISYRDLLDVFWAVYNPSVYNATRQYMSIIFYHDDEQKQMATETKALEEAKRQGKIWTEIVPATGFYLAEDYHQKYYLRRIPQLESEFEAIYPEINDFVNSTAVARINGYAVGLGTQATFQEELDSLGLSSAGKTKVLELAEGGLRSACPVPQPVSPIS